MVHGRGKFSAVTFVLLLSTPAFAQRTTRISGGGEHPILRVSPALRARLVDGGADAETKTLWAAILSNAAEGAGSKPGERVVERDLIDKLLQGFRLTNSLRGEIGNRLNQLLAAQPVDLDAVIATLTNRGVSTTDADVTARLLLDQVIAATETSNRDAIGAATGVGASDRLYTTVELYSYSDRWLDARLVSAVSLSDADTTIAATTVNPEQFGKEFRTRTADVLTAIQDGGAFAGQLNFDLRRRIPGHRTGWLLKGSGTAGKLGSLTDKGRMSFGGIGELSLFSWTEKTKFDAAPKGIIVTGRGGCRYADSGIIDGDPLHRHLCFAQAIFEGRPEQTALPLGFTMTWVENTYKPYAVQFQIFGIVGM